MYTHNVPDRVLAARAARSVARSIAERQRASEELEAATTEWAVMKMAGPGRDARQLPGHTPPGNPQPAAKKNPTEPRGKPPSKIKPKPTKKAAAKAKDRYADSDSSSSMSSSASSSFDSGEGGDDDADDAAAVAAMTPEARSQYLRGTSASRRAALLAAVDEELAADPLDRVATRKSIERAVGASTHKSSARRAKAKALSKVTPFIGKRTR